MGGGAKDDPPTLQYSQRTRAGSLIADDPTTLSGQYALGELIGKGGVGEVYVAFDKKMGRDVAMKRLRTSVPDEAEVARFLREARIQARLEHPAIAPVYELAKDDEGRPYFTMKRLAGKALNELIGIATRERMLRAFADVCRAIDYAHSRGVVHCDLKPSNIMLGEFGEVYVIDWGVARELDDHDALERIPEEDVLLGTPKYMAPEQRYTAHVEPPADIYALGKILGEILGEARPLELDALCAQMLNVVPEKRPTARACADRIEQYMDGDRDLARRRALAEELLTFARSAHSRNARGDAMRGASQALALDPRCTGAAELVTTLMLQPPPEPPPALQAALDDSDRTDVSRHAKAALPGYLLIAALLPCVVFTRVLAWPVVIGAGVAALAMALAAYRLMREPERSWRWMVAYGIGNAVIVVMLARLAGPFTFVPALVSFVTASVITYPAFLERPAVLLATMLGGWLLPIGLEVAHILPATWTIDHTGLAIHGGAIALDSSAAIGLMIVASLAAVVMAGVQSTVLGRAHRKAQHQLVAQAWQLRQLLPIDPSAAR
ncbi:MAG: serine/threonine protein kinase [Deltaproteobacteria bacterium]|nr:serine/threonine protein kinase [Deltaproteobacteria bacterium]